MWENVEISTEKITPPIDRDDYWKFPLFNDYATHSVLVFFTILFVMKACFQVKYCMFDEVQ